jgi:hypothetical protein
MGRKVSDGKATNVTFPAGQVINDYDLYRVGGWNIAAIGALDATETDRTRAGECDPAAVYSVKLPAGLNPAAGDKLYWATNDSATFQRGDTNLAAAGAAGQLPCAHVLKTKNAAGYAQIRIEQS